MEPTEANDPIDSTEPAEPIDSTEPAEPIERMDPAEPMHRIEPAEPMDWIDRDRAPRPTSGAGEQGLAEVDGSARPDRRAKATRARRAPYSWAGRTQR